MADNVAITAGVGTPVASDDVGGVHFQRIKLDIGGDGATSPVVVGNPLPVQHQLLATDLTEVAINCAASGDNSIVALTAGQIIRVWAFWLKVNGSGVGVNLKWRSATSDLHPALPFNDKDGWVMSFMSRPWFTCVVAEALQLNLSAAIQVSGRLYYTKS